MKFLVIFLFWIKQKRQNKDVLVSKGKVTAKQTTLLHNLVTMTSETLRLTSVNLENNEKFSNCFAKVKPAIHDHFLSFLK